jgi:D-serine deaminase-like pyridoxal phosphate-dependent protein
MRYSDMDEDARMDLRDEYADEMAEHKARKRRYRCGGYSSYTGHCGATDCDTCHPGYSDDEDETDEDELLTASSTKVVTARKARLDSWRLEVRPGDSVRVTTGFTYVRDGERVAYFKSESRVAKGKGWPVEAPAPTTSWATA